MSCNPPIHGTGPSNREPYASESTGPPYGAFSLVARDGSLASSYVGGEDYTLRVTALEGEPFRGLMLVVLRAPWPGLWSEKLGTLAPLDALLQLGDRCSGAAVHTSNSTKMSVAAAWHAPPAGSGPITLVAVLVRRKALPYGFIELVVSEQASGSATAAPSVSASATAALSTSRSATPLPASLSAGATRSPTPTRTAPVSLSPAATASTSTSASASPLSSFACSCACSCGATAAPAGGGASVASCGGGAATACDRNCAAACLNASSGGSGAALPSPAASTSPAAISASAATSTSASASAAASATSSVGGSASAGPRASGSTTSCASASATIAGSPSSLETASATASETPTAAPSAASAVDAQSPQLSPLPFRAALSPALTLEWAPPASGAGAGGEQYAFLQLRLTLALAPDAAASPPWLAFGLGAALDDMIGGDVLLFDPAQPRGAQLAQYTLTNRSFSGLRRVPAALAPLVDARVDLVTLPQASAADRAADGAAQADAAAEPGRPALVISFSRIRAAAAGDYPGALAFPADGSDAVVLWAVGRSGAPLEAGHAAAGSGLVNFDLGSAAVGAGSSGGAIAALRIAHGLLMFVAFGVLLPAAAALARFAKGAAAPLAAEKAAPAALPPPWWFSAHWRAALAGLAVAALAFVLALAATPLSSHFRSVHAAFGLTALVAAALQGLGASPLLRPSKPSGTSAGSGIARAVWQVAHRSLGYATLALGAIAIPLGLLRLHSGAVKAAAPLLAAFGFYLAAVAAAAVFLQRRLDRSRATAAALSGAVECGASGSVGSGAIATVGSTAPALPTASSDARASAAPSNPAPSSAAADIWSASEAPFSVPSSDERDTASLRVRV